MCGFQNGKKILVLGFFQYWHEEATENGREKFFSREEKEGVSVRVISNGFIYLRNLEFQFEMN